MSRNSCLRNSFDNPPAKSDIKGGAYRIKLFKKSFKSRDLEGLIQVKPLKTTDSQQIPNQK